MSGLVYRSGLKGVIVLAALPVASAVYGQQQIGETGALPIRVAPQARVSGEDPTSARNALRDYGSCVVKKYRKFAKRTVDLPFGDRESDAGLRSLATPNCLANGSLQLSPLLLRGAVIEALYKAEFGTEFEADLSKVAPFDYAAGYKPPLSRTAQTALGLAVVADCAVRLNSAAARQLINNGPNSAGENSAIAIVAQNFGKCVSKGESFKFSRPIIRSAVAEATYRLSQQSRSVPSAARSMN
jgi:hypothetical protein